MIPHKLTLCLLLFLFDPNQFSLSKESLRLEGVWRLLSMSGLRHFVRRHSSMEDSCAGSVVDDSSPSDPRRQALTASHSFW